MRYVDKNLNEFVIESDGNFEPSRKLVDYSIKSDKITVYFRELEDHLVRSIDKAQVVVGCVAWLTSERVLEYLARVSGFVAIVVQKEDFLRPDLASLNHRLDWKIRLRSLYESLSRGPERQFWPGLIGKLSVCSDPRIEAVRCVGNYNIDKSPAFPRMHHKFFVFCRFIDKSHPCVIGPYDVGSHSFDLEPYAVWTGSYNPTHNARFSLENAVLINDETVAAAYYREWEQIAAISEPLDWTSEWAAPEWRIGT